MASAPFLIGRLPKERISRYAHQASERLLGVESAQSHLTAAPLRTFVPGMSLGTHRLRLQ